MVFNMRVFFLLMLAVFLLSSCYSKPVRHLGSDVAMLNVGESTSEDVLIFLGDPDDQKTIADGVEQWLYKRKDATMLEKTPYAGKYFGSPEYSQVVVTIKDGIVIDRTFSITDGDDMEWADDYSWQEKKSD